MVNIIYRNNGKNAMPKIGTIMLGRTDVFADQEGFVTLIHSDYTVGLYKFPEHIVSVYQLAPFNGFIEDIYVGASGAEYFIDDLNNVVKRGGKEPESKTPMELIVDALKAHKTVVYKSERRVICTISWDEYNKMWKTTNSEGKDVFMSGCPIIALISSSTKMSLYAQSNLWSIL